MNITRNSNGQPFTRLGNLSTLLCALALTFAASAARASDPNGIYAFVDRVVFEPNEGAPERIQVWGGFALARGANSHDYHDAGRGYMYFKLRPGDEAVCRKEWADLKSVAGTRQIVSFGSRFEQAPPKVRKADAKVENPDVHPKSWGMTKTRMRDYTPISQLESLMAKTTPAAGSLPAEETAPAKVAPKAGGN